MAGKISEMTTATLAGTELIECVQSGDNLKTTPDAIRDRAIASLGSLTAASALTGAEVVGVTQGGAARRTTAQEIASLSGDVVDSAPSIAQEMWHISPNFGGGSPVGFTLFQSGMTAGGAIRSQDRALSFITGAGTTANVWTRYSASPTWDQRIGSDVYTRRSRGAFVIQKPFADAVAWIHVGSMLSSITTGVPTFIFGVEKNLSDVWQIVVRNSSSVDQITPVTLSVSEGQVISVFVEITGDGSTNITGAKIGVFDYLTGVLIDKATWTGTLNVDAQFVSHCLRPTAPTPSAAEELLRIYYQAYGPVPSRATNPFFAQL